MTLYGGIDLHANNSMVTLLDEQDHVVHQKRLANQLDVILGHLAPYQGEITGLVVESTYNWYWLVDGLMDAGYKVHLANTSAIKPYEGLKYSDDEWDSRCLAHLLRLGVLPEGYIYPKAERPVRDLLRKRSQLVSQKMSNLLSIQTQSARNTGHTWSGNRIKQLTCEEVESRIADKHLALAITSNLVVIRA